MIKRLLLAGALLAGLGAALTPLMVVAQQEHDHGGERTIYTCGMHPQIVQEGPGTCPICGMDLTPKKIGGETKPSEKSEGTVVTIDPVVVQNMGVRIAPVTRGPIFRHVRTIGTVEVAEDELSVVNLRYSGWVERIYVDETGVQVKAGSALFDIYSPELVSAQEEYLLALRSGADDSPLLSSARRRLEFLGLSSWHIDQVRQAGKPLRTLHVVAPRSGWVLHKNIVQGARVQAGTDLYRIGNLAKIWVNAEVYEFDAPWIAEGQPATMELSFQAGKTYDGKVSYIHPTLSPKTRTLKVRLEFDNPGLGLKPGMFATVLIEAQRKEGVLQIPSEAIIHSGTRQVVFVATELGKYAMREITTGLFGDRQMVEIRQGLEEGEPVVTSGQFLLDSESQLQEAVQKLLEARLQAKKKRTRAQEATPPSDGAPSQGEAIWRCPLHPKYAHPQPGTCPICGIALEPETHSEHTP